MTKHVTCIKRYTRVQSSQYMPRKAETIVEDDELEEEIGQQELGSEEPILWDTKGELPKKETSYISRPAKRNRK